MTKIDIIASGSLCAVLALATPQLVQAQPASPAVAAPTSASAAVSAPPAPSSTPAAAPTPAAAAAVTPAAGLRYSLAAPAVPPDAAALKDAKRAEKDGATAARASDYATALAAYRRAYELTGSESALAAAADCHERLGELVQAHDLVAALIDRFPHVAPATRAARARKLVDLAARTAVLAVDVSEPGASIEVDGKPIDMDPSLGGLRLSPGDHRLRVTKAERATFETSVLLEAGKSRAVAVKLAPVAATPAPVDRGEVRDFCFMKIPKDSSRYQKQRVVLFGMAGEDVVEGPEAEENAKGETLKGVERHVLRDVGFHSHARNVFLATFPMDRFFTVNALVDSPAVLRGKTFVADADMIRAATTDTYAAYSIACADWIGMPRVTNKKATWAPVKRQRMVNGKSVDYMAWDLRIVWDLETAVYKHEKDGWKLFTTVEGTNGGLFGVALTMAALAPQKGNMPPDQLISKRPAPSCSVPLVPALSKFAEGASECENTAGELRANAMALVGGKSDGEPKSAGTEASAVATAEQVALDAAQGKTTAALATAATATTGETGAAAVKVAATAEGAVRACKKPIEAIAEAKDQLRALSHADPGSLALNATVGLAACAGVDFTADLSTATAPGTAQLRSTFCKDVKDDVSLGATAMEAVARCSGRIAVEAATLDLQKHVKEIEGFRIFAKLQALADHPERELYGIAEGQDEGVHRGDVYVAFVKAADGSNERVGYGRIQSVGPGGPHGEDTPSHFKFRTGDAAPGTRMEEHPQVGVPLAVRPQVDYFVSRGDMKTSLAFGAALEGGYNASQFVPIGDEVWGKAFIGYAHGSGNEGFITIELVPEVVKYLGGGFAVYGTSGFTAVVAMKSIESGSTVNGQVVTSDKTVSGMNFGAEIGGGLDYSITPDWNARLSVAYRQGFYGTKLEDSSKSLSVDAGTLSLAQAGLSAGYTF